jgi:hypothetical protein
MRRACDVTCDKMSMREGVAVPTGLTTGNVQRRGAREHEVRIWGSHDKILHASDRFPEISGKSRKRKCPRHQTICPSHIASTTLPFEVVPPSCSDCSRRVPLIGAPASLLFMRPRGVLRCAPSLQPMCGYTLGTATLHPGVLHGCPGSRICSTRDHFAAEVTTPASACSLQRGRHWTDSAALVTHHCFWRQSGAKRDTQSACCSSWSMEPTRGSSISGVGRLRISQKALFCRRCESTSCGYRPCQRMPSSRCPEASALSFR